MCLDSLDGRPGRLPDTRILSDATVLVVFQISWGQIPATRGRLVLRFDQHGGIFAALQRDALSAETPDHRLR
jgi:hypothetical protein